MALPRSRLGYIPALDGLRALAVGAVLAYHLGFSRAPGGFVGVEVFFVLSGWLVCALLAREHEVTGAIDLRAFWLRRARRLLPAVTVVLATTLGVAALANYDRITSLRLDAGAAVAYVLNWRFILDQQSYFEAAAGPSALQHLWSLSIEEQLYVLVPLALGAALGIRRTVAGVAPLALAAAAAATAWRLGLLGWGVDVTRVYYGTDTRAAGLLAGAALGLVWAPGRLRAIEDVWAAPVLDITGLAALGVLGWYTAVITEQDADAFGWSLTAVQLATVVLVAVVVHPVRGWLARGLAVAPLRWVGRRSYGIYLWHWPVIVAFAKAPGEQPDSPLLSAAMIGLTLSLASLSYRWIEQPVLRRGFQGAATAVFDRLVGRTPGRPVPAGAAAALVTAGIAGGLLVVLSVGVGPSPDHGVAAGTAAEALAAPSTPSIPGTTSVGDSIMRGATGALSARIPDLVMDAQPSRHMEDAPAYVNELAVSGRLRDVVVLHLGANGPFSSGVIDQVMDTVGDRLVLLVNVKVPRRWESEVNETLADGAARHPNARLVDWHAVASDESGLLQADGGHLTPRGAQRYAELIVSAISEAKRSS